MAWNVGRTPPASGNMITAGHGPAPSGVCKAASQVPSDVCIDTSRSGMRLLSESVGPMLSPAHTGRVIGAPNHSCSARAIMHVVSTDDASMLAPYRVLDLTDGRAELATFVLAG